MALTPVVTTFNAPVNYLANEHYVTVPGGVTFDNTLVLAVNRILVAGTPVAKLTSGKWAPYLLAAPNGQAVALGVAMNDVDCNNRDARGNVTTACDAMGSVLIHGFIKEAALPAVITVAAKATMPGVIFV